MVAPAATGRSDSLAEGAPCCPGGQGFPVLPALSSSWVSWPPDQACRRRGSSVLPLPAGPCGVEGALGLVRAGSAHPTPRSFHPPFNPVPWADCTAVGAWLRPAQPGVGSMKLSSSPLSPPPPPIYGSPGLATLSAVPTASAARGTDSKICFHDGAQGG